MDRRASRRQFLRLRNTAAEPPRLDLLRVGRPAMGTLFEILFPSEMRGRIEQPHRALDEVRRLERMLSYFNSASEVCRLNREASDHEVEVAPEFFELVERSRQIWNDTGGAFDIAAGALWRAWGFDRRQGRIPSPPELETALRSSGVGHLRLFKEPLRIGFGVPGLEINLGSIGKGFALDRAGAMLQNSGFETALLHSGRSSFLALGDSGAPGGGWLVSVRHPVVKDADLFWLQLKAQSMATSGGGEQNFEVNGRRFGHILDPRTGVPCDRFLSVTVLAPDAALADALSTAFFVMTLDEIEAYCSSRADVGAIVAVLHDESPGRVKLQKIGGAGQYVWREFSDRMEVES